jgi:Rieske Fe-S protein
VNARRIFIATGLALLGVGRRAWAQLVDPSVPVRYATLTSPVTIPVESVTAPWRAVPFVAEARVRQPSLQRPEDLGATGTSERRVLISGVLFRRASAAAGYPNAAAALGAPARDDGAPQAERAFRGAGAPGSIEDTQLSALCVTCPHEQCQVDLVTDRERLARMTSQKPTHPLFECGCHFSVFDAANEGARLSGESPRGLYRFRVAGVRDGMVEITEIEAAALSEV